MIKSYLKIEEVYQCHIQNAFHEYARTVKLPQRSTLKARKKKQFETHFFSGRQTKRKCSYCPTAVVVHVTYLSVFNVLKSTRLTPLGIFKDFITSAVKRAIFNILIKY